MKRFLLSVSMLALTLSPVHAQKRTVDTLRAQWENVSIAVDPSDSGIVSYARAVAGTWTGQALFDELSRALTDHPDDSWIDLEDVSGRPAGIDIDRSLGRLSFNYYADGEDDDPDIGRRSLEMALLRQGTDGMSLAVRLFEEKESAEPLLMLYRLDAPGKVLQPIRVPSLPGKISYIHMPTLGEDIFLHFKDDRWVLLAPDGSGGFKTEALTPAKGAPEAESLWQCFITDTSPTNVRFAPKGRVCCQLPVRDDWNLCIDSPRNGWWCISFSVVSDEEHSYYLAPVPVWIHSSVVGLRVLNDDGIPEPLYTRPDNTSPKAGTLTETRPVVHPVDLKLGPDKYYYVKVNCGKQSGWLRSDRLGQ